MRGFTLIETILVLVIVGILAAIGARVITSPIDSLDDATRRAELVRSASPAIDRLARELRAALPGSVRIDATRTQIEFLHTVATGRYRIAFDNAGAGDPLDLDANADTFDVIGGLDPATPPPAATGTTRASCLDRSASYCVAIYNTGLPGANAWAGDNIAAVSSFSLTAIGFSNADVAGWSFPFPSPAARFFLVDGPVLWACDRANGTLRRYAGHPIAAAGPSIPAGVPGHLALEDVTDCRFAFDPGTATRTATATITLTVSREGEPLTLIREVHIPNAP